MEDNNIYYKKGRRYIPFGLLRNSRDYIPDGIWYVHHTDYSSGITNVDRYLSGMFKVGEAKVPDFTKVCGEYKLSEYVLDHKDFKELIEHPASLQDIVAKTIAIIAEYDDSKRTEGHISSF